MPERASAETTAITPEICYANFNLPRVQAATAGPDDLARIMDRLEDNSRGSIFPGGFELTLTRKHAHAARSGEFARHPGLVTHTHQAWAKPLVAGFRTAPSVYYGMFNALAYGVMPSAYESLETIRQINDQLGELPLCGYPEVLGPGGRPVDFRRYAKISGAQIQLETLEALAARAGDRTGRRQPLSTLPTHTLVKMFHTELRERGMSGVVFDSGHALEGTLRGRALIEALRRAGTTILSIHFSVGRIDFKNREDCEQSMKDLEAVFAGPDALAATEVGKLTITAYQLACEQRRTGILPRARWDEVAQRRETLKQQHTDPAGKVNWRAFTSDLAKDPVKIATLRDSCTLDAYLADPHRRGTVAVTPEIPYAGLEQYWEKHGGGKRLSRANFVSLTRTAAASIQELLVKTAA